MTPTVIYSGGCEVVPSGLDAEVWQHLRRQVQDRPAEVRVTARIRRDRLDLAVRILGGALTGPPRTREGDGAGDGGEAGAGAAAGSGSGTAPGPGERPDDWALLHLAYPVLPAVRQLLQFGDSLEVLAPPEARRVMAEAAAALTALYAAGSPSSPPSAQPPTRHPPGARPVLMWRHPASTVWAPVISPAGLAAEGRSATD
ncbi:hypothetical protein [Streptomyces sp. NPDC058773]|uniref:hypothetical protein n=1 Tax=Streptomyces sp. NPDC058773 TaxID=3346632 RepID=UPI0036C43B79